MLCERCQAKPAKVSIRRTGGNSGEALSTAIEHHLCEGCARDYIQGDPQLRTAKWSEPTKIFKTNDMTPHDRKNPQPPVK